MSSPKHFKSNSKRILYQLSKKTNLQISDFRNGSGGKNDHSNIEILRRLKEKGFVAMSEYSDGNIYYLTETGRETAKPIVEQIDQYKKW